MHIIRALTISIGLLLGAAPFASAQDFNKGLEAFIADDYATALKEWKPLAEQGNAKAQYSLGWMYKMGEGVIEDYAESGKWYRLSAEQGYAFAQFNLGLMYEAGNGVFQDKVTAHMWYNTASANGQEKAGEFRDKRAGLMTADASLTDTYWRIDKLFGYDVIVTNNLREPHLVLRGEGQNTVNATVGCNRLSAPYAHNGLELTFGRGISTRMACLPPLGQLEQQLILLLEKVESFWITGEGMVFLDSGGDVIANLAAVYLP